MTLDDSRSQPIVRGLMFGILGVMAVGLAPLLLTRLQQAGNIDAELIGIGIFVELMSLSAGTVLGRKILGSGSTASKLPIVLVILAASNVATVFLKGPLILTARIIAGLAAGMLIWVAVVVILRAKGPQRLTAVFLTTQTISQFMLAVLITTVFLRFVGPAGGYWALAALSALSITLTFQFPNLRTIGDTQLTTPLSPASWLALLSTSLFMAMLASVLSYAEVYLQAKGVDHRVAIAVVPIVLGCQVVGGITAALIGDRIDSRKVIVAVTATVAVILYALTTALSTLDVYLLFSIFGFCWLFIGSFHLGWILLVDASRRTAEFIPAFQLTGMALGPLGAALLLRESGAPPVSYYATLLALSAITFVVSSFVRRHPVAKESVAL